VVWREKKKKILFFGVQTHLKPTNAKTGIYFSTCLSARCWREFEIRSAVCAHSMIYDGCFRAGPKAFSTIGQLNHKWKIKVCPTHRYYKLKLKILSLILEIIRRQGQTQRRYFQKSAGILISYYCAGVPGFRPCKTELGLLSIQWFFCRSTDHFLHPDCPRWKLSQFIFLSSTIR
jgi:hypothetical protein